MVKTSKFNNYQRAKYFVKNLFGSEWAKKLCYTSNFDI